MEGYDLELEEQQTVRVIVDTPDGLTSERSYAGLTSGKVYADGGLVLRKGRHVRAAFAPKTWRRVEASA